MIVPVKASWSVEQAIATTAPILYYDGLLDDDSEKGGDGTGRGGLELRASRWRPEGAHERCSHRCEMASGCRMQAAAAAAAQSST